ncbi:MAG TPA: tetratricopeptide repeat protein [Chloroflexia bacterium]|jgi:tetratricopeptide (TPR) repeat protein
MNTTGEHILDIQAIDAPDISSSQQMAHYWTAAVALQAAPRLELALQYQDQYEHLDIEFPNLLAAHSWLVQQHRDGLNDVAARLLIDYVVVLAPYLHSRGLVGVLLRWCEDGLQACSYLQENPGPLLLLRAEAQFILSQWNEAEKSMQAALAASEDVDAPTYAQATLALGRLQLNRGNYAEALANLAKADTLLAAQADLEGLVTARMERAAYHLNRRELDRALALYLEADQLDRQVSTTMSSDRILLMLGVLYRKKRDYPQAATYLQQVLDRGESQKNPALIATSAHHLAWVRLAQGDSRRARRLCGHALTLYRGIGDIRGISDTYEQLGLVALASSQIQEGRHYLDQSLVLRRQVGNQQGVASSLRRRAIMHVRAGHLVGALYDLWQSLGIYRQLGVLTPQQLASILLEMLHWIWSHRGRHVGY